MRQPKLAHSKTQTPIVAKQVEMEQGNYPIYQFPGICVFSKFIEIGSTNRYSIPVGNYTRSIIQLVWHNYDTIPIHKYQHILVNYAFSLCFWYAILTENRKGWGRYGIETKKTQSHPGI